MIQLQTCLSRGDIYEKMFKLNDKEISGIIKGFPTEYGQKGKI